jgi:aryl-alcohol dehydrogenase-like predicted oxidoreductase
VLDHYLNLGRSHLQPTHPKSKIQNPKSKMTLPTTNLGNTGLIVSRLALGTMTFGLQSDEETATAILDTAAAAGINFLDTADVYPLGGDLTTVGRTEEILGRWLKGKRDQFIVATKFVARVGPNPWDQGASRKHILDAIDASLRRLDTDYIDLYQLHADDPTTPFDETLEALDTLVKAGKVRYIGVSNFLAYRLSRALGRADVRQLTRFVSIQPRYNLLFREIERELLPLAQEEGLGVIPYNPLAGGLLTGKHLQEGGPTAGTRFTLGSTAERYQERYWHDREFKTVEELRTVADAAGVSLTTLAIAWVLANPVITAPIIGASRPEQLADNLKALEFKLDDSLKQKLDDITSEYRRGDAVR